MYTLAAICITCNEITHTDKNLPDTNRNIHTYLYVHVDGEKTDTNPFSLLRRQVEANDRAGVH